MGLLIPATTLSVVSPAFNVDPGTSRGVIASGLAGSEAATLQVKLSDGTWANTTNVMTATEPAITIQASGTNGAYRVSKSVTAGAAFVDMI